MCICVCVCVGGVNRGLIGLSVRLQIMTKVRNRAWN